MDQDFWHQKWKKKEIGFHEGAPNALLVAHFDELDVAEGGRIFLPLCGKTVDIAWLLSRGYQVVGAELSTLAIEQLFSELGVDPEITQVGSYLHYRANNLDIFVGDIFELSGDVIGAVDAIYDRAALVALPEAMRKKYTRHLIEMTGTARQLLITFEYDQSQMDGPPFSISSEEVNQHYEAAYQLQCLESVSVAGGLKGVCAASEHVWLLK